MTAVRLPETATSAPEKTPRSQIMGGAEDHGAEQSASRIMRSSSKRCGFVSRWSLLVVLGEQQQQCAEPEIQ